MLGRPVFALSVKDELEEMLWTYIGMLDALNKNLMVRNSETH